MCKSNKCENKCKGCTNKEIIPSDEAQIYMFDESVITLTFSRKSNLALIETAAKECGMKTEDFIISSAMNEVKNVLISNSKK
ncbi:hypothetical protein NVP1101O_177 [Vibrio phage 1.101.O._10N.261.45.C6]|nr:hypothetical protein NVP1101O_177 [Vibrio phage 1.101.O._10N.261.45.C6]